MMKLFVAVSVLLAVYISSSGAEADSSGRRVASHQKYGVEAPSSRVVREAQKSKSNTKGKKKISKKGKKFVKKGKKSVKKGKKSVKKGKQSARKGKQSASKGKKSAKKGRKSTKKGKKSAKKGKKHARKGKKSTKKGKKSQKKGKKSPKKGKNSLKKGKKIANQGKKSAKKGRISARKGKQSAKKMNKLNSARISATTECEKNFITKLKKFVRYQNEYRKLIRIANWLDTSGRKKDKASTDFNLAISAMEDQTTGGTFCTNITDEEAALANYNAIKTCPITAEELCDISLNASAQTQYDACFDPLNDYVTAFIACWKKAGSQSQCDCFQALQPLNETVPGVDCENFEDLTNEIKAKKAICATARTEGSFGSCRALEREAAYVGPWCGCDGCTDSGTTTTTCAPKTTTTICHDVVATTVAPGSGRKLRKDMLIKNFQLFNV